ncbi:MAG TPA: glycosyltransferase family 4 protein [Thermoanaerobaculia bacterium]|jgi:glycosyltransferase involved in cell wall biosynthesis
MSSIAVDPSKVAPEAAARRRPIAVLLSRFPTVTETFILREVDELERQGQPVRLVPMIKESPPVIHNAAKPWTERALYTRFVSGPIVEANLRMLARHPVRYLFTLAACAIGTMRRANTFVRTLALFPKSVYLAGQLQKEGVRHLHVHFASHPTTMALVISRFAPEITFSFTVHAHDIQVDRSLLAWKLRTARFVRSISAYNKRFLEELYPKASAGKIHVIHVGIEPDTYDDAAQRLRRVTRDSAPRILCVAAHKPYKGIPYLIEACRLLRDEGVDFQCNLIGDGPMRSELEQMIRERNLGDRVHLLGPRPEEEVARMMSETNLFVLASIVEERGKMEGIPVALMEAMAAGRAVVSTATSGIPELVEDGVNGVLVPQRDPRALADAMRSLLSDPERAHQLGERGREKVRREFTLRTCVAELLTLIDRENGSGVSS